MKTETVDIATLNTDPANVRKHGPRNLDTIKASLKKFGQQKPIVIGKDGVVVAGNGTLDAARELGWDKLDVVRTKLTGTDAAAYAIADNRTAELAEWDNDALAKMLSGMKADEDFDHLVAGFTDDDLENLTGVFSAEGTELPSLPSGDRDPIQQMTFTLTDEQAEEVKRAMAEAKAQGDFVDTGNENSNGNALARIAESYCGAS